MVSFWYRYIIITVFHIVHVVQIVQIKIYKKTVRKPRKIKQSPATLVAAGLSWDLPDLNREPAGYESAAQAHILKIEGSGQVWYLFGDLENGIFGQIGAEFCRKSAKMTF